MSSIAAVSTTEGQGRLWERMAIQDMNVRIEHLMQSLIKTQKSDPALVEKVKKEYENDIKTLFDKIDRSFDDKMKDWENARQILNQENNNLRNEIDVLRNSNNRLQTDVTSFQATNQNLQIIINKMTSTKKNDSDNKLRDLQNIKDNLDKEKNALINENLQLTTENKNTKLLLQKAQNQIDTLKMENNSLQQQNTDLTKLLNDVRGEMEKQYKDQINGLTKDLNKTIKERNDKDFALQELQTKCNFLQAKCDEYNTLLKDQVAKLAQKKKANVVLNKNDEFYQRLQAIKEEYDNDLRTREGIWEKAKEESLKTLNEAYRTLKEGLGKQNEQLRETVQQYSQSIDELKKEVQKLREQKKTIRKR